MTTEKIHIMSVEGAVELDLATVKGQVRIAVDPKAVFARLRVHTTATEGPAADAVRTTEIGEYGGKLVVSVPEPAATDGIVIGGNSFGGGTATFNGSFVSDGDIWIGGRPIVVGGRVVVPQGTVVTGGSETITVDVVLPAGSSSSVQTKHAETTVRGALKSLRFRAHNGSLKATRADVLDTDTHNGSVLVETVDTELKASTHNGSINIGAYHGRCASVRTHNGNASVAASPASTGRLTARTHNGNIHLMSAGHLDLKTSTHCGRIW
ncbi:hypothetical protein KQH21_31115 [Streptomyces sp. IpFD-1.1]|uniref:hypothetical protein n=1 Tax=unclassified Streptomyces TaxID=2593676 RepID=UPI00143699C8|nr:MULTISPECIES: hypothetical protein [unclassified Streptomyces]MBV7255118.1 hypothetical protein [Streptomyces sp. S-2]MCO6752567.1 hypothetical protein [Streptomyces sp. IpFD-1.1]